MGQTVSDCPLDRRTQTRNLLVFAGCTALQYLAAPVGYVGITQASLCRELGASNAVANLPETAYLGLTFAPVIFAWLLPYISWLRWNLAACYGVAGVSLAAVAAVLAAPVSAEVKIVAVVIQAGIAGITIPSAIAFLWEALGRGVEESRRGLGLALGFGVGPLFGAISSKGSHYILNSDVGSSVERFALLYGLTAPLFLLAGGLCLRLVIPPPEVETRRRPFVPAVFGGAWDFLRDRVLLLATVVTILLYTGNTIASNLNLYSQQVFGDAPMLHAGNQNAARFLFKTVVGLLLGWLLMRTNPKAGLLLTGTIFVSAVVLAMVADADTYLIAFGVFGAGELVGVYAPNYLLAASRPHDIRRNMAFVTMMMVPAAPAGYLFGVIADVGGRAYGPAVGFRLSFAACLVLMLAGLILAAVALPARPRPSSEPTV